MNIFDVARQEERNAHDKIGEQLVDLLALHTYQYANGTLNMGVSMLHDDSYQSFSGLAVKKSVPANWQSLNINPSPVQGDVLPQQVSDGDSVTDQAMDSVDMLMPFLPEHNIILSAARHICS